MPTARSCDLVLPQQAPEGNKPMAPQPAGGIAAYVMALLVGILLLMACAAYLGFYKGRGGAPGSETKHGDEKKGTAGAQEGGKDKFRGGHDDDDDDSDDADVEPTSACNPTTIVTGDEKV
jgi:hypothetical protein